MKEFRLFGSGTTRDTYIVLKNFTLLFQKQARNLTALYLNNRAHIFKKRNGKSLSWLLSNA